MAAMGIITELVGKSKKSRNCIPNTVTRQEGQSPAQHAQKIIMQPMRMRCERVYPAQPGSPPKVETAPRSGNGAGEGRYQHCQHKEEEHAYGACAHAHAGKRPLGMVMHHQAGPAWCQGRRPKSEHGGND